MDKQGTFVTLNIVMTLKGNKNSKNESVFKIDGADFIGFMNKSISMKKRMDKIIDKRNRESCILKYRSQVYKKSNIFANSFNTKV